ncbi:hypothetical protein IVB18_41085 [Bradyrhizobium sp. 186]|nr:hypothetical protein [Bradyrhizobium sp. 186]UPK34437.1 hypothetical protein IVB18_41085 [Bradyrhizobium sp. 186]
MSVPTAISDISIVIRPFLPLDGRAQRNVAACVILVPERPGEQLLSDALS